MREDRTMFAVGFIGKSGVGKTTLIEKVVARLIGRGYSVSTVKSSHHNTDVDIKGKDSWRYREAGAHEVMLVGPERWALMKETKKTADLQEVLARMAPVDFILVEGYKSDASIPRILIWRKDVSEPFDALPAGVVAVATDDETLSIPDGVERIDLKRSGSITNFVVRLKANGALI